MIWLGLVVSAHRIRKIEQEREKTIQAAVEATMALMTAMYNGLIGDLAARMAASTRRLQAEHVRQRRVDIVQHLDCGIVVHESGEITPINGDVGKC